MMLRYSFNLDQEANAIEQAIEQVLKQGYRTIDTMSANKKEVSCSNMGDLIAQNI